MAPLHCPTRPHPAWSCFGAALRRALAPYCVVCGVRRVPSTGEPACTACVADFFPAQQHRCPVCALRLPGSVPAATPARPCGNCLLSQPAFNATIALADYAAPVDGLIAALKFHARLDVGWALGWLLAQRVAAACPGQARPAAVLPLPLSALRLRERGYNQSEEIARTLARQLQLPLLRGALLRVRHCPTQQGLGLAERRTNVRAAFALAPGAVGLVAGRHLLLVDDVLTTGSTLGEAADCLRRAGAARVANAVVARTP